MALQYTSLTDDDLSIDYEDGLATAVAVREDIQANDVSSSILEATSAAMRSLLTSFGELFDPPGSLFVLFQFKLVYQRAGPWEYLLRDRVAKFQFCLPFGTKNPDKFDEPRIKGPIEVVKSYKQMHYDGEVSAPKQ